MDQGAIDEICARRNFERFSRVVIYRLDDLQLYGLDIFPTFRTPHVTIAHANLDALIVGLSVCRHEVRVNKYHQLKEGEPDV